MCLLGLDLCGCKLDYEHGQRIQQAVEDEYFAAQAPYQNAWDEWFAGQQKEQGEGLRGLLKKQPEPLWKLAEEYYEAGRRDMEAEYKRRQREHYLECIDEAIRVEMRMQEFYNNKGWILYTHEAYSESEKYRFAATHHARHFHVLG